MEIVISDTGFQPDSVTIVAGQGVHWTNESIGAHSVTSTGGLFDSGSLQPQAGFSVALAIPGVHSYHSTSNPDFQGQIHVVLDALSGPADEPANDHIPDITFPAHDQDDWDVHPDFGFRASRTHILLGFVDDATVAQANAAIHAAKVVIIGGLPNSKILLVAAEATPDFSGLTTAIDVLLAQPVIEFAAMSPEMELKVVPRAAESETAASGPNSWDWNLVLGPNDEPAGVGGNWGLEASRFPQAWNLLEEIRRSKHFESIITGIVDAGFGEHKDLAGLTPMVLCKPLSGGQQKCTATTPHPHGVAVSGVIGATLDNNSSELGRSLGISGANPVAQMYGVNFRSAPDDLIAYETSIEVFDTLISQFLDLRVINFSMAPGIPGFEDGPDASGWWAAHGMLRTCGPGGFDVRDDGTPAANQFCTPNNEDEWLGFIKQQGMAARTVAENAAANGVIIVQAAGNEGNYICIGDAPDSPGCVFERLQAKNTSPFAWASSFWESNSFANPIVVAEAVDIDNMMPLFSNAGGDLSAPGVGIVTTAPTSGNPDDYIKVSGTSLSAPYITGLIGYMLAFDPMLSVEDIITGLVIWGRQDVSGGGQPRIDAYGTMMSLPGAAKAMVDVNDLSKDGNRRIVLGPPNAANPGGVEQSLDLASSTDIDPSTGTSYHTDPDGSVDMRDFRRWRDAYLQVCQNTLVLGEGDCLELDAVSLNGANDHPKKDLNFDRCVHQGAGDAFCPTPENTFPRFDFNGDGRVSLYDESLVPLKPDGTPASVPSEATMMTDLDVLMSQWDPDLEKTEGYTATQLPELVNSGDLEIHAQDLFDEGATDVEVKITRMDTNEVLPLRAIAAGDYIIYTIPAGVVVNIEASATVGDETIESTPVALKIPAAGSDARFQLCIQKLELTAFPPSLEANGSDTSTIDAKLQLCDTDSLDGLQINFSQTPEGSGHGKLKLDVVGADPGGDAANSFTAGTQIAEYEVTAAVTLANGDKVEGKVKINTTSPLKIAYRWQQTILQFIEQGSSRWPSADPSTNAGDCDGTVIQQYLIPDEFAAVVFLLDTQLRENGLVTKYKVHQDGIEVASYGYDLLPGVELPHNFHTVPGGIIGWDECIDAFSFEASPVTSSFPGYSPPYLTLNREGILKPVGDRVLLDEFVTGSEVAGDFAWSASASIALPGASPVHNGAGTVDMTIPSEQTERYKNYALPDTVSVEKIPDGLRVSGLNQIAELEYPYESIWKYTSANLYGLTPPLPFIQTTVGNAAYALEAMPLGTHQAQLMLVPRGDGSALQYAGDVSQPITFLRDEFGNFQKYEYCDVVDRQYETPREYVSNFDAAEGKYWKRNSTYDSISIDDFIGSWLHEYPMPVGPGSSKFRYSFVAIPYRDDAELEAISSSGALDPPNCDDRPTLTASFDAAPNPADEGSAVKFTDTSASEGNSIVSREWEFGDGESSTEQNPTHFYKDNGEYFVTLGVSDATGQIGSASRTVVINNVAPEVRVDDAMASEGEAVTLTVLLADPGELDQAALDLHLEISGGVANVYETRSAGIHSFTLPGLGAGNYTVIVTATDKDGGVSTDSALIQIFGPGETPPPPPPPPPPTATCDPSVKLDSQEQAFLDLLNAYRIQSGVAPLDASPGLTRATTRHAVDMATHNFLDDIGSDGSTPADRAIEEGYPSDEVDEVLVSGLSQAVVALFAWKSSPPHKQILLDPRWNGVGIAREHGADWYWAADFGEVLDCPSDGFLSSGSAPAMFASAADSGLINLAAPPAEVAELTSLRFPPIPAFVISNIHIAAGQGFIVRNVSRDASGQPIAAVLDPGDGTGPFNMGAGAGRQLSYADGGTFNIGLTATDSTGLSLAVQRAIEVAAPPTLPSDFNLTISPDTHVMAPGTTVNFLVSLAAINGFSSLVDLSVGGLPSGVTAQFTPSSVMPSATSILQIVAASNAQTGQFQINVRATGGGITHTTSGSVTLNFGLVPICYGAFQGTITDAETGLPLPGAQTTLGSAKADSTGHYVIPKLNLNSNNAAKTYTFDANAAGYWFGRKSGSAQCDIVTTVDFQLVKIEYASMSGFVFVGEPDPKDHSANRAVFSTGVPLEGARVGLTGGDDWRTDSNGFYDSGPTILPGTNNAPRTSGNVQLTKVGYWSPNTGTVLVEANKHIDANFTMVPICYANISGTVAFGDTGLPANLVELRFFEFGSKLRTDLTDASGQFSFTDVLLGRNNSSIIYSLTNPTAIEGYKALNPTPVTLLDCGADVVLNLVLQPRVSNFSAMQGHVFDAETGEPLSDIGVSVSLPQPAFTKQTTTDSGGGYNLAELFIGYDTQTSISRIASAFQADYWTDSKSVTLQANQVASVDFTILKKRFGFIAGTVRDATTHNPIEGASLSGLSGSGVTDVDGHFQSGPLGLQSGNKPNSGYSFTVSGVLGYWNKTVTGLTVQADTTTIVDADLIPICEGATIVGTVVNAATGQSIEGVKIKVTSATQVFTDANGNFVVQDVKVGTNNSPLQVAVEASKAGFVTQTKTVTVFCNASIVVNFGESNTAVGMIQGTVTDATTGQPMQGMFIGSEFGGSATSNAQGQYTLSNVPLGLNNSDRQWKVTSIPSSATGFRPQTKSVAVKANTVSMLDFTFSQDQNDAPTLDPVGNRTLAEAETLDVPIHGSDINGDPITLSASGLPSFATFADHGDGTGTLHIAPGFADAGVYLGVKIIASDAELTSRETITITVNDVNRPPVADAGGPHDAMTDEDTPVTMSVLAFATDADGDTLTVSASDAMSASGGTVACTAAGDCTYTPAANFGGSDTFNFTINDGRGGTDSATVHITVGPVNDAPSFTAGPNQIVQSDAGPQTVTGWAANISAGPPNESPQILQFVITTDLPSLFATAPAVSSDGTLTYTPAAGASGVAKVSVQVRDDGGIEHQGRDTSATETFTITVTPRVVKPEANAGGQYTVAEGQPIVLDGSQSTHPQLRSGQMHYVWDLDGDGIFGETGPGAVRGDESGMGPSFSASGLDGPTSLVVRLRVSDDLGNSDEDTATVQVVNTPPTLTAGNSGPIQVGRDVAITAIGEDPGGANDLLKYEFDCDGDGFYEFGPQAESAVLCVFDRDGTFAVTVRAADGDGGQAIESTQVLVQPAAPATALCSDSGAVEPSTAGAGRVSVRVLKGQLQIRGDRLGNNILIQSGGRAGSLIVTPRGDTQINRKTNPREFRGVRDVDVGMGPGDDVVAMVDAILDGGLTVRMDEDNDLLLLCGVDISGPVQTGEGLGQDMTVVDDSVFRAPVSFGTGNGDDEVLIETKGKKKGQRTRFHNSLKIRTEDGRDRVKIGDNGERGRSVQVDGCILFQDGGETDSLELNRQDNSFACLQSVRDIEGERR